MTVHTSMKSLLTLACAVAAVLALALSRTTPVRASRSAAAAGCTTTASVFPLPAGADGGAAYAKSGDEFFGEVHHPDGTETPASWSSSSGQVLAHNLGPRGDFRYGSAMGIDDAGDVLLEYTDAKGIHSATYLLRGSTSAQLLPPAGMTEAFGQAISADGYVVGSASRYDRDGKLLAIEAVMWPPGQARGVPLRPLTASSVWVVPLAINAKHDIVGFEAPSFNSPKASAAVWPNHANPLPGPSLGADLNEAWAVNASGIIAGWSLTPGGTRHAIVAAPFGPTRDLGALPGDVESFAYGINDSGTAVGDSFAADGSYRAFLWTSAGGMRQLLGPSGSGQKAAALGVADDDVAWGVSAPASGRPTQPTVWTCISATPAGATRSASPAGSSKSRALARSDSPTSQRALPGQRPQT